MLSDSVAIIGTGLLGGSLAGALKTVDPGIRVHFGGRRAAALEEATAMGLADFTSTNLAEVVKDCQWVILCTPIETMPSIARAIAPHLSDRTIVTDVGSAKRSVCETLTPIFGDRTPFIGSHPMAGSERTGLAAARPDLFRQANCVVTPLAESPEQTVDAVVGFWQRLGMHVRIIDPTTHDRIVAQVSHLPHLAAAALVEVIADAGVDPSTFGGSGYRDTTRIAAGAPGMWLDILLENRDEIIPAAKQLSLKLQDVVTALENNDRSALLDFLQRAKAQRDSTT